MNRDFLPVRVNVRDRPDLATAFMVPGIPAHLFICPIGTPLGGALGYRDTEKFLELISLAQNEARRKYPDMETREVREPNDRQPLGVSVVVLFSLLMGLVTPFSPCILPLLPVMYLVASRSGKSGITLFALGLFSLSALLGAVAAGSFLAIRILVEPLAYALLFFAGVALPIDRVSRGLSYLTSKVTTRLYSQVKRANPFMLGALSTIMWGPCAAPMAVAAFSLAAFSPGLAETVVASIAFAASLAFAVYILALSLRKMRFLMKRVKAVKNERGFRAANDSGSIPTFYRPLKLNMRASIVIRCSCCIVFKSCFSSNAIEFI